MVKTNDPQLDNWNRYSLGKPTKVTQLKLAKWVDTVYGSILTESKL